MQMNTIMMLKFRMKKSNIIIMKLFITIKMLIIVISLPVDLLYLQIIARETDQDIIIIYKIIMTVEDCSKIHKIILHLTYIIIVFSKFINI